MPEHQAHIEHPPVPITVNREHPHVAQGRHSVANIKVAGKVPLADDLEEVIHGQLKLLPDDGTVEIKGGEHFVSHPKDAGSS